MKKTLIILIIAIASFIFKANAQVNFQWAKSMGATGNEQGYSIAVDASGNVYTTGDFYGVVDFDPGAGVYTLTTGSQAGIFVSKLDASGNFVWAKKIGGANAGGDMATSIAVDGAGNVYTTGYFFGIEDFDPGPGIYTLSPVSSYGDAFISKLDPTGGFVWAKSIGSTDGIGGFGISIDGLGNVYTTGYFFGTADFDPGIGIFNLSTSPTIQQDIFVCKLDASGAFIWAISMGGTSLSGDGAYSITVDASGYVYTTGGFTGTADFDPGAGVYNLTSLGNGDIFVSKLDPSGVFVWAKQMGGTGSDNGYSIDIDVTGNIYTTGSFTGTVDFDPGVGIYNLTATTGSFNAFISKLDASGTFVWAKNINVSSNDIEVDVSSNVYITGGFSGTSDFDPDASIYNLTSAGQGDIFVSKLDATGSFVWTQQMGGTANDYGNSIAIDPAGNVYVTGGFNGTADFDPGVGTYNLTSFGANDVFVVKLDGAVGIEETLAANNIAINIFPNPNNGNVNIAPFGINEGELQVSIKDVTGKNIYDNNIKISNGTGSFLLDVNSGIYFMEILESRTGRKSIQKLVVQK